MCRSSVEAKYRAMANTICERIWLKALLQNFGVIYEDVIPMHCDYQAAIHIASNPVFQESGIKGRLGNELGSTVKE